jgi:16S rRNA (guanine966-N2)-methyltransferase
MRIVAGRLRGRPLTAPKHDGLRPTSDRVRESVFNILAHGTPGFDIANRRVIDLFAGTGALGIEAISRGAAYALFVEEAPEARALIRQNVEAFGLTGETRIFRRDATDLGPIGTMERFDLAVLDPPYGKGLGEKALAALHSGGWLNPDAIVVFEERSGTALVLPPAFSPLETRSWGDTEVRFLRYAPQ